MPFHGISNWTSTSSEMDFTGRLGPEIAMQAVRNTVAAFGNLNICIAGHSLGAAMAMLAGKTMAKTGIFLEAFLFNPPFFSAPIERIKDKKLKHGIRIASSFLTAGLAADHFCSEYIGYFEHRKKMEEIGAGGIGRLATQNSIGGLFMSAIGKESDDPLHLIPSANLTVNLTPAPDLRRAHGIHQWWRPDLHLKSKLYKYK
ncbi:hypothetical protein F0562_011632 [Nyssa sinensis]|uniref:Fungal lipase-type domain-containing protein n=1 Tax=Nyssa sinensis TaxID=561372 RepID=A0A5J4ZSE0_9ASTE|nr:hypothetical protein F0562_011632 [Nyssa sinensis]